MLFRKEGERQCLPQDEKSENAEEKWKRYVFFHVIMYSNIQILNVRNI